VNRWQTNFSGRWHWVIRLSHWTSLLLLVPLFYSGLSGRTDHFSVSETHANLGLMLFGVLLVRLLFRVAMPRPVGYRSIASMSTQFGIYLVLFGLLVSGLMSVQFTAFLPPPTVFGGFEIPDVSVAPPQSAHFAHRWLGYALIFLVALHILSAIWHWTRDRSFLWRIL
jgi:cytochrome b561